MWFEGFEVVLDYRLTETKLLMLEPPHRFIEYDSSDEWWLVKYGYAKYIPVPSRKTFQFGNKLLMHPATWNELCKELEKQRKRYEGIYSIEPYSVLKCYV